MTKVRGGLWEKLRGRGLMTTSAAAENIAGRVGDKEKVEKRRALGRGLESLLPGPRVVAGPTSPAVVPRQGVPGPGTGAAAKTEVPHFVRDDNTKGDDKAQTFRHDHGEVARDDKPQREGSALG